MPWTVYNSDGQILQGSATLANDSVDSQHYVAASIDNEHLADDAVDSDELAAGAVDLAHMSVNSIDSDQYVDGSIDLVHMSDNSIDSDQYVDASIDNAHLADDAVGIAELSATGTASSSTFLRGDNAWAAGGLAGASQAEMEAYSDATVAVTPPVFKYHPGSCKAWGQAGDTGVLAAPTYNLTGMTHVSTGLYTVTFDTDFSDNDQSFGYGGRDSPSFAHSYGSATGTQQFKTYNSSGTLTNKALTFVYFGDQ